MKNRDDNTYDKTFAVVHKLNDTEDSSSEDVYNKLQQ